MLFWRENLFFIYGNHDIYYELLSVSSISLTEIKLSLAYQEVYFANKRKTKEWTYCVSITFEWC